MNTSESTVIELNKTRATKSFLLAIAMFFLALWALSLDDETIRSATRRFNNPMIVHLAGGLLIPLSCLIFAINIKRFFSKKPGLILNKDGVFDCSGLVSEVIPWSDITGVNLFEIHNEKMVAIQVANPEKYLRNNTPSFKLSLRKEYFKICGSPIAITPASLNVDVDSLLSILLSYLLKYGKQPHELID